MYWHQQGHNSRSTHVYQKKISSNPHQFFSIYKSSINNGIESENEFFHHQNESTFRSQILAKSLTSKQLYSVTSQPYVTLISIKFSRVLLLARRLLLLSYLIPLIPQKLLLCSLKHKFPYM